MKPALLPLLTFATSVFKFTAKAVGVTDGGFVKAWRFPRA